MPLTIFARQAEAIGLYQVCEAGSGEDPGNPRGQAGWEAGINYDTIDQLANAVVTRSSSGHIYELGISCHGSDDASSSATFGGVAIQGRNRPWLLESNVASFLPALNRIGARLEQNAVVYFFACRLGGTDNGRRLLMRLSQVWPNRRVVGFVQEGHQHDQHQNVPSGFGQCELPGVQFGSGSDARWGDWGNAGAVSARNGRIVRF
jgi:hypothetical protein